METNTLDAGTTVAPLGLGSVLVDSLPGALLTPDAPERYTVEAVLTRRAERDEVTGILSSQTRDALREAGYPTVEVSISDRRLEIANTSLEELRDGLAGVLAERLAQISGDVRVRQEVAAAVSRHNSERELERATAVVHLAQSVVFEVPARPDRPAFEADSGLATATTPQIDRWAGDGGHEG